MIARVGVPLVLACLAAAPAGCEPGTQAPAPRPVAPRRQTQPASAPAAPPGFLAAVGYSAKTDPVAAAEEAARKALAPCRAAGAHPAGAIFLERIAGTTPADGDRIARAVAKITGAATFGQGDLDAAGSGGGASRRGVAGLMVLVLAGKDVRVRGLALGGAVEHVNPHDPAHTARYRTLREACTNLGRSLGARLAATDKPALVLALGAVEGEWSSLLFTALRDRLGADVPLVGAAGGWNSYVCAEGAPAGPGVLAVAVAGDLRVAVETVASRDPWDAQVALAEARRAAAAVAKRLAPDRAALALAFSAAGRAAGAQAERTAVEQALGAGVALFGCSTLGEAGAAAAAPLSAGCARFVLCGVAERE